MGYNFPCLWRHSFWIVGYISVFGQIWKIPIETQMVWDIIQKTIFVWWKLLYNLYSLIGCKLCKFKWKLIIRTSFTFKDWDTPFLYSLEFLCICFFCLWNLSKHIVSSIVAFLGHYMAYFWILVLIWLAQSYLCMNYLSVYVYVIDLVLLTSWPHI